jgi:hypothetical protein
MSLKRYQVMLSDWMGDYVKFVAERYDLTTSDVIRGHMCFGFLYAISMMYPEFKSDLESKKFAELPKKVDNANLDIEELHKLTSKIIFEARKAVEYRFSKIERKT